MQIVWFKRDLRVTDHEPLTQASQRGQVLPLYIFEPDLWKQPDMSRRHFLFLKDCLKDLDQDLRKLGHPLVIRIGDAITIFETLVKNHGVQGVWSHNETGNTWTYERDKALKKWLRDKQIPWHSFQNNGVIRGLKNRDGWAGHWARHMKKPVVAPPSHLMPSTLTSHDLFSHEPKGFGDDPCPHIQKGGRQKGLRTLQTFFSHRGETYSKGMSSPVTAFECCSRLSTHFAFGTLSIREVFQETQRHLEAVFQQPEKERGRWPSALMSFSRRLRWHCHFIQKLEDDPRIEFENMHSAYDSMDYCQDEARFTAWAQGRTGYPMVDACMRALHETGWLNFRMRAMLMSFAAHHLFLHWRQPALHLARLFTDYEPGIHYPQVQMQSGTTGINSIRIYSPIKQGKEHDPEGVFIKTWVPELQGMPGELIHTPWLAPERPKGYPLPLVDEVLARKEAAKKLYSLRKNPDHHQEAKAIVQKHASRQSSPRNQRKKKQSSLQKAYHQGVLPL